MCKSHNLRVIDKCMRKAVKTLDNTWSDYEPGHPMSRKVVACCCGHGRYPMTIVYKEQEYDYYTHHELFSGKRIPRKKRFYLKDKKGYYYIPEVLK